MGRLPHADTTSLTEALSRHPQVTVTTPLVGAETDRATCPISMHVIARGERVTSVVGFVNGKAVFRNPVSVDQSSSIRESIPLAPGDNTVEVFVINSEHLWSNRAMLHIHRTGAALQNTLYAVCVGIDHYADASLQPTNACKDADRFAATLKRAGNGFFQNTRVSVIKDPHATRADIDTQVQEVMRRSAPEDAFIFYFSGHGLKDDVSGQTLLAAADLANQKNRLELQNHGISTDQIKNWATRILAQRQLWVLDACHTGSLADNLHQLTLMDDFRRLQFGTGVYLAAAVRAAGLEQAHPDDRGGLFTSFAS